MIGIGIDFALRKGSVVVLDHTGAYLLSAWNQKKASATVQVLVGLLQRSILRPIEHWREHGGVLPPIVSASVVIGIDWDPREAFWGSRKSANKKTFGVGYLYRAFLSYDFRPLLIPPSAVRRFLGLSPTEKKGVVHERFLQRAFPVEVPPELLPVGSDNLDALILATVAGEFYATGSAGADLGTGSSRLSTE